MEIPVTRNAVAIIDNEDHALVAAYTWRLKREPGQRVQYAQTHCPTSSGSRRQRTVLMHRLVLGAQPGQLVDHINGDGLDNRRVNLRLCAATDNARHRVKPRGYSNPYKGITLHRPSGKWQASIKVCGRSIYLGLFDDPVHAARAYDSAALNYFGEYALLNFPVLDGGPS